MEEPPAGGKDLIRHEAHFHLQNRVSFTVPHATFPTAVGKATAPTALIVRIC